MRLMNYEDVETIQTSRQVEIREGIEVAVRPLPVDWDDIVERNLPSPRPKQIGVERDGKGRVLYENGRPIPQYDVDNPEYRRAVARHSKRQTLYMLLEGLEPGQVVFDAPRGDDLAVYLDAVLGELKAFGFSMGDLLVLVRAISELSGVTEREMEIARRDFSEPGS